MSKIQADEISSIIKERIDNFELSPDNDRGITIISINVPGVSASCCLQEAVRQLNAAMFCTLVPCSRVAKSINDLQIVHENVYPILKDEQHNKYGWYRKFEKKRF